MGTVQLSEAARQLIEREREGVATRAEDLTRQVEALEALTESAQDELRSTNRLLQQMDELLGLSPEMPIDLLAEELRGRRLREVAVAVLRDRKGDSAEIHYRDWLGLLADAGLSVGGKNPAATFLTQITSAPEVESVRPRSGLFRLKKAI
jgi:hypothetical protein